MEGKKQTAVEWLMEEMSKTYIFNQHDFDMFKQAKQMEKEQIKDAYFIGGHDIKNNRYRGMHEYYEQTYGGNK
jgi:hypothetical protein